MWRHHYEYEKIAIEPIKCFTLEDSIVARRMPAGFELICQTYCFRRTFITTHRRVPLCETARPYDGGHHPKTWNHFAAGNAFSCYQSSQDLRALRLTQSTCHNTRHRIELYASRQKINDVRTSTQIAVRNSAVRKKKKIATNGNVGFARCGVGNGDGAYRTH